MTGPQGEWRKFQNWKTKKRRTYRLCCQDITIILFQPPVSARLLYIIFVLQYLPWHPPSRLSIIVCIRNSHVGCSWSCIYIQTYICGMRVILELLQYVEFYTLNELHNFPYKASMWIQMVNLFILKELSGLVCIVVCKPQKFLYTKQQNMKSRFKPLALLYT